MAIASARRLVELLGRARLLEPERLEEVRRSLAGRPDDPLPLARELLRRDWLTAYQVNQLFNGHADDLLLGHYVLLERLGEGGMGQVFKARETRLGRVVALKVLRKERLNRPEVVRRFYQEIQAAARVSHPNVVHAYDAEQIGDTHVFAMEYVDGADLARLVKEQGPLPVGRAADYARQAACALQHLHENGMVHRDVKPANLMRTRQGEVVKLLDLGVARLLDDAEGTRLTRLGSVVGTVDFLAPEQALDARRADIRSDLYGLGCTLYFLLTGRVPFPVEEAMAKLLAHQCDPAVPVERLRPDVPPKLAAVVAKLMAKRPEDRYQTPAELVHELADFCGPPAPAAPVAVAVPADGAAALPAGDTFAVRPARAGTAEAPGRAKSPWRRRGRLWLAAAVLVVLLSLGVLGHVLRRPHPPPTAADPPPATAPGGAEFTNSLGMKLVRVADGDFFMGSAPAEAQHPADEMPSHRVRITRPFYLGAVPVTVGQFRAFAESAGHRTDAEKAGARQDWRRPGWEQADDHPAACLSWNDAKAFCDWLTRKEGQTYRLPTEAEWEYACRADSDRAYCWGPDPKKLDEFAWHRGNAGGRAHPVGTRKANAWGLYDMHGNLRQWCGDWYDAKFYQKAVLLDPPGPPRGARRVLRGGWWNAAPADCRCARRGSDRPESHGNDRGFRVVLAPPE